MSAKIGCENLPKVPGIPAVIRLLDLNNPVSKHFYDGPACQENATRVEAKRPVKI